MLRALQGNILPGHGRHATAQVFRFDLARRAAARPFRRSLGARPTPAHTQHAQAARLRAARAAGKSVSAAPVFDACVPSHAGYVALGVPAGATPTNAAFVAQLKARGTNLKNPKPAAWDKTYRDEVHATVLLAGDPDKANTAILNLLLRIIGPPRRGAVRPSNPAGRAGPCLHSLQRAHFVGEFCTIGDGSGQYR